MGFSSRRPLYNVAYRRFVTASCSEVWLIMKYRFRFVRRNPTLEDTVFKPLDDFIQQQAWLDSAAGPLQAWINDTFSRGGDAGKTAKNFLNGTWLGHPLHPVITDVPIGAWIC